MTAYEQYENTAGEIEARNAANRRNLTVEERKNTPPILGDENAVFAERGSWTNAAYDPETSSIKEQLANKQDELQNMEPVAKVTVPENLKDKRTAYNWPVELLKPTGYRVERQGFGTIWFEKDDINYGLNYADTPEEKAALALLPKILKRGIEIGRLGNHKLRQKETLTFAAPAEVNGTRVNMAAVVTVRNGRYYTHRIVLPDGTVFKFGGEKNNDAVREPHRGVPTKGSLANATSTASNDRLPEDRTNVKQYSISSAAVDKKSVAVDLRGILNRGGNVAELRQYIDQLERGGSTEQTGRNAERKQKLERWMTSTCVFLRTRPPKDTPSCFPIPQQKPPRCGIWFFPAC